MPRRFSDTEALVSDVASAYPETARAATKKLLSMGSDALSEHCTSGTLYAALFNAVRMGGSPMEEGTWANDAARAVIRLDGALKGIAPRGDMPPLPPQLRMLGIMPTMPPVIEEPHEALERLGWIVLEYGVSFLNKMPTVLVEIDVATTWPFMAGYSANPMGLALGPKFNSAVEELIKSLHGKLKESKSKEETTQLAHLMGLLLLRSPELPPAPPGWPFSASFHSLLADVMEAMCKGPNRVPMIPESVGKMALGGNMHRAWSSMWRAVKRADNSYYAHTCRWFQDAGPGSRAARAELLKALEKMWRAVDAIEGPLIGRGDIEAYDSLGGFIEYTGNYADFGVVKPADLVSACPTMIERIMQLTENRVPVRHWRCPLTILFVMVHDEETRPKVAEIPKIYSKLERMLPPGSSEEAADNVPVLILGMLNRLPCAKPDAATLKLRKRVACFEMARMMLAPMMQTMSDLLGKAKAGMYILEPQFCYRVADMLRWRDEKGPGSKPEGILKTDIRPLLDMVRVLSSKTGPYKGAFPTAPLLDMIEALSPLVHSIKKGPVQELLTELRQQKRDKELAEGVQGVAVSDQAGPSSSVRAGPAAPAAAAGAAESGPQGEESVPLVCAHCGAGPAPDIRLKLCSGCRSVRYCGGNCQRLGWPGHKAACKAKAAKEGGTKEGA